MSLLAIPYPCFTGRRRVVVRLDPWPQPTVLTPAQIAQRRRARVAQIGKMKAPNRVQR